ncbi:ATP phosphoribosyltransferase [Kribbella sp. NPDC023855]|uniref:ATP phosphoribosyltransferase n=1 Tax=Kribbella sp. NPDC023855 TaxID=3154698 RepID=UPI0033F0A04D
MINPLADFTSSTAHLFTAEARPILAVPNAGRLLDETTAMVGGLVGMPAGTRGLVFESDALVVLCARSNDLPYLLDAGLADLIVTGHDYVLEAGIEYAALHDTGFQSCTVGVVGTADMKDWRSRPQLRVVTQYPGISRDFFAQDGMPATTQLPVSGAAELYARCGLADVVVDAYMTGDTARANGLELLEPIVTTSARVYARPDWQHSGKDLGAVLGLLT